MATIERATLGVDIVRSRETFYLTVEVIWDPSEIERDPEFQLRAWLFEEDGPRDEYVLENNGKATRKRRGNSDDIRREIWDKMYVHPSDGTTFDMGRVAYNVYYDPGDDAHAIHEWVGEFFAIVTISPVGASGDIKSSNQQKVKVEW